MSSGFKVTLATIALIWSVVVSGFGFLVITFGAGWSGHINPLVWILSMIPGPLTVLLFIFFLKKRTNVFLFSLLSLTVIVPLFFNLIAKFV